MNKRILTMAVAALALAACSENETTEVAKMGAIGFNGTGIANITRAESDVTADNFAQFKVHGGYNETDLFGVMVNKSGNTWSYSPLVYWTAGETYKFGGYAPEGSETNGIAAEWAYTTGLKLTINSDAAHQNDVVYADAEAQEVDLAAISPFTLEFGHLLSKIQIKLAKDATTLGGQTLEIRDLKLAGNMETSGTWNAGTQAEGQAVAGEYGFGTMTIDAATAVSSKEFYVIPQATSGEWTISFAVTVKQNGEELTKGTVTAKVPTDVVAKWEAGNMYCYSATITVDNIKEDDQEQELIPIEFTASAENWNPAQDVETTLDDAVEGN